MFERLLGKKIPLFEMNAALANRSSSKVSLQQYLNEGKWVILIFYPMDFTPVCSSEITVISDHYDEFKDLNTKVLGISTDTVNCHLAWMKTERFDNGVGQIAFPLGADPNHRVCKLFGVLDEENGTAMRSTFIISPEGLLMYENVFAENIGRDVDELLRVLQALQMGGLCPANWKPGMPVL